MAVAPHPHFSGWRVCAFAALTQAIAIGFTLGTVGVFAAPIASEFGSTATQFNFGVALFSLVMNASMPLAGRLLDRGAIRLVMAIGAGLLALGLLGLAQATALWQVGLLFGVVCAVGMAMLGPMASSTAMAMWFDRMRGRALGFANAGGPAGPVVIAPLAAFTIEAVGWRTTLLGFAAITLVVGLPAVWLGIVDRPADVGQQPDGGDASASQAAGEAGAEGIAAIGADPASVGAATPIAAAVEGAVATPWDASAILRSRDFWLLALAAAPFGAQGIVVGANSIPYLMHHGATAQAAALAPFAMSLGAIAGPLVLGSLADRIHPRLLFLGLCGALCLAFGGLMIGPGFVASLALLVVCGVVGGSMMPVYGALIGRLFGVAAFGQVMGLAALVGIPMLFLTPIGFGQAVDRTGGYAAGLMGLVGLIAVAMTLFALLPAGPARRATPVALPAIG
ncbi:MAG: MFS transporter [Spirochaetaceae bacterium]|nr:MFS transporter [Spirochaetaceae bacterium]